jgi:hypothetical protein
MVGIGKEFLSTISLEHVSEFLTYYKDFKIKPLLLEYHLQVRREEMER